MTSRRFALVYEGRDAFSYLTAEDAAELMLDLAANEEVVYDYREMSRGEIDRIEDWEAATGLDFDTAGPALSECDCGAIVQYVGDEDSHLCWLMRAESLDAARREEDYR